MSRPLRLGLHAAAWSGLVLAGVLMWRFGAVDAFLAAAIAFCM